MRNKVLNRKNNIDRKAYKEQRNYVVNLPKNQKNNFYNNPGTKIATDNKAFWKTVKPLLSEKFTKHSEINLAEGDKIISHDDQIAKTFSKYFIDILILNMLNNGCKCPDSSKQDSILKILNTYLDHSSIKLIKAKNTSKAFKFGHIDIK